MYGKEFSIKFRLNTLNLRLNNYMNMNNNVQPYSADICSSFLYENHCHKKDLDILFHTVVKKKRTQMCLIISRKFIFIFPISILTWWSFTKTQ